MLTIHIRMFQAQWQESLQLAAALCAKLGRVQFCGWSSINELRWTRPVGALRFLIPSKLEESEAQLTEKQAVLSMHDTLPQGIKSVCALLQKEIRYYN